MGPTLGRAEQSDHARKFPFPNGLECPSATRVFFLADFSNSQVGLTPGEETEAASGSREASQRGNRVQEWPAKTESTPAPAAPWVLE